MPWFLNGVAYDLEPFARVHPGGAALILETRGQDISTLFYTQHRDPERFLPLLSRFATSDVKPATQGAFHDEKGVLKALHQELGTQKWRETVALSHTAFVLALLGLTGVYGLLQWRALVGGLKPVPFAVLLAVTRVCLTVVGKRFVLRRPTWINTALSFLMDLDYRGSALAAYEARLRNEGPQIAELRRLEQLPRGLRLILDFCRACLFPLATLVALGSLLSRLWSALWLHRLRQIMGCLVIRGALIMELWLFIQFQKVEYWLLQCLLTTLLSLMMALCYPPMPMSSPATCFQTALETPKLVLTGSPYLDALLTGGLSCERVHRLIPFQWSPFANIATEPLITQLAQEKELQWGDSLPLLTDVLPGAICSSLLETSAMKPPPATLLQEYFSWGALSSVGVYLWESLFIETVTMSDPFKRE